MSKILIEKETVELALESLKELVADPECDFGPSYELQQERQTKAIAACRKALMSFQDGVQPAVPQGHEQGPVAWLIDNDYTTVFFEIADVHRSKGKKVEPLYTIPPQPKEPEQEPVANVVLREGSPTLLRESDIKPTDERLYTTQPVLASDISQERVDETQKQRHDITPPQRTWVGLSVFEINDLVENTEYEDYRDLVERTEAKLKEKNT